MELSILLEFDIVKQGILVEQALTGQGIYITKAESEDDRFMKNLDRPKVIVEVPDTGFSKTWDDLFHKYLVQYFRDNGMRRFEARRAARSSIEELRNFGKLRMRDIRD